MLLRGLCSAPFLLLSLYVPIGCAADDGDASAGSLGTEVATGAAEDDCTPGTERCPCHAGECFSGLQCLSDVCVEEPPPPAPEDSSTSGGSGADGGDGDAADDDGGDDGPCVSDVECSYPTLCHHGACTHVHDLCFDMRVHRFNPYSGCDEGFGFGNKDLYYRFIWGGTTLYTSSWTQGGCPGAWPNEVARFGPASSEPSFSIAFYDKNTGSDTWEDTLCFASPSDPTKCGGTIPAWYLWAGELDSTTGNGSGLRITFDQSPCD